jgi:hypothetical protein
MKRRIAHRVSILRLLFGDYRGEVATDANQFRKSDTGDVSEFSIAVC